MKFMDALATGLPMRRVLWTKHPPLPDDKAQIHTRVEQFFWLFYAGKADHLSPWVVIGNGDRVGVQREDLFAADWEVMGTNEMSTLRSEVEALNGQLAIKDSAIAVLTGRPTRAELAEQMEKVEELRAQLAAALLRLQ